ncbi:hypothetical protein CI109_100767 [Kwoniella shandongensis]|uniref:CBM21 domain-containing protein n=1 Tax=Kwoniella shandongensis TaxID=1734106 RepID=A0AAJ8LFJ6_9TREE
MPSCTVSDPVSGSSKPKTGIPTSISIDQFYPTPPPSPILVDTSTLPNVDLETSLPRTSSSLKLPQYRAPISLVLDTSHHLPHAAGFRLTEPTSLLATLGGNRVLALDACASVWDRMPISASTPTVATPNAVEEDHVESLVGGQKPQPDMHGLHWAMRRQKSADHISSIFVHPPTPERIASPTEQGRQSPQPTYTFDKDFHDAASTSDPIPRKKSPTVSPIMPIATLPAQAATGGISMPVQVLPEVRSPPRRSLAMTADSLQVAAKRGRRPRLFGFTEMPDSVTSSAASSAASSPDRTPTIPSRPFSESSTSSPSSSTTTFIPSTTSSPATFIPRRHPIRAKSEAALTTAALHTLNIPPRRRENGLKLNFDGIVPVTKVSEAEDAVVHSPYSATLIRKKSGEILKPALKYIGPLRANGTPIAASLPSSPRFETRSCPATPSCPKYVHFDAKLERVKLFLHDQKPQVVSRDGSPTADTTSEGDEFPFPSTDEEREEKKVLQVSLPNFPTSHPPNADLFLESLFLDDDRKSLKGVVTCKNIAFQKWVAVRFTFDWWQTTSEVTATYKESVKGGQYDRFAFSIKLNDLLSKIEEKTLFMAIRYNAEGTEMWDSNGGQNYQVLFQKVSPAPTKLAKARNSVSMQPGMGKAVGGRTSQWSVTDGTGEDRLADLRAKLDRLKADDEDRPPVSPNSSRYFSFTAGRKGTDVSPTGSPMRGVLDRKTSDLPAAGPALAARYDFGAAFQTTRRNSPSPMGRTTELPDVKTGLLSYSNIQKVNNGHAATEFYSPRYTPTTNASGGDYFFSPTSNNTVSVPVPDLKVQGPSPPATEEDRTPTGTAAPAMPVFKPVSPKRPTATFTRAHSSPSKFPSKFMIGGDDADEFSPEVFPPQLDSSNSMTATPSESPRSPPDLALAKWSPTSKSGSDLSSDEASLASYSSLIEQFCWAGDSSMSEPRRSHSTSSLDNYFATEPSGLITPRATAVGGGGYSNNDANGISTPSSTSSYFTSFSGTPTTRDDIDDIERSMADPASGMNAGRIQHSMVC